MHLLIKVRQDLISLLHLYFPLLVSNSSMLQTLSGNKQAFNFEPTDTILQIKQALQEKEGIEIPMIRLIFGGKQLADEQKISDYNLEAGSTIHMVLQLRGGSF